MPHRSGGWGWRSGCQAWASVVPVWRGHSFWFVGGTFSLQPHVVKVLGRSVGSLRYEGTSPILMPLSPLGLGCHHRNLAVGATQTFRLLQRAGALEAGGWRDDPGAILPSCVTLGQSLAPNSSMPQFHQQRDGNSHGTEFQ